MRVFGTKQLLLETENNKVSIFGNTASLRKHHLAWKRVEFLMGFKKYKIHWKAKYMME